MNTKTILSYALVLMLGAGIGFFVGNSTSSEKQPNKSKNKVLKAEDHLDWTHTDLLKYFQGKGFDFKAESTDEGKFWGSPMNFRNSNGEILYVRLHETTEKSQNRASGLGTQGFTWGKFMFKSDSEELLKNISGILDNKYNDDFEFLKAIMSESTAKETEKIGQGKITDKVSLVKIVTGYYTGGGSWAPSVVLTFKNISKQDITDYSSAEVVFFDEDKNEQLSAKKRYFVGIGNTRLAVGNTTRLQFVSDLGWSIIPFGRKIIAKIYVENVLVKTVSINETEIDALGN